jgi:hypothetical protein
MKKNLVLLLILFFILLLIPITALAQTLTMNDATVTQTTPHKVGLNLGTNIVAYGATNTYKNQFAMYNPGFAPAIYNQIWTVTTAVDTSHFIISDSGYDAAATIPSFANAAIVFNNGNCAGSKTASAVTTSGGNSEFTLSVACSTIMSVGDIVSISVTDPCTTQSHLTSGTYCAIPLTVNSPATATIETSDLPSVSSVTQTAGALDANATAGGSVVLNYGVDVPPGASSDNFVLVNGAWTFKIWGKLVSGSPTLSISGSRPSGFSISGSPTLTSTWQQFTITCSSCSETSSTPVGEGLFAITVSGGRAYITGPDFEEPLTANTTVFRDAVVADMATHYQMSAGGHGGLLRAWVGQNGDTMTNLVQPLFLRSPSGITPQGSYFPTAMHQGFKEVIDLAAYLGAEPYYNIPGSASNADVSGLVTYIYSNSILTETPLIHFEFGNEQWNSSVPNFGGGLGYRASAPTTPPGPCASNNGWTSPDATTRVGEEKAAMAANSHWSSVSSGLDLIFGLQDGNAAYGVCGAQVTSTVTSTVLAPYTQNYVGTVTPLASLWNPALAEPWSNMYDSNSEFYQVLAGAKAYFSKVGVYEFDNSTSSGSTAFTQSVADAFADAAGYGTLTALQAALWSDAGYTDQAFFALNGYCFPGPNSTCVHNWGQFLEMGGATNNTRPQELGMQLFNGAVIGSEIATTWTSRPTYSLASNSNGYSSSGVPANSAVPTLYGWCWKGLSTYSNANNRACLVINTSVSSTQSLTFATSGSAFPSSYVWKQFPATGQSIGAINEATGSSNTMHGVGQNATVSTTSVSSTLGTITLQPYSTNLITFQVAGGTTVATPTASPAAGSYGPSQTVTLSDSTSGASIYYTTNGTTPTSSSTLYTGAITVTATETIQAIAEESGDTNSAVASFAYTINGTVATPTFTPAAGSYSSTQSVVISDATGGATIYYTTNGTTPTTGSSVYSTAIPVAATETVQAIAVESGYTTSAVGSAAYTISGAVNAVTSSPGVTNYPGVTLQQ